MNLFNCLKYNRLNLMFLHANCFTQFARNIHIDIYAHTYVHLCRKERKIRTNFLF